MNDITHLSEYKDWLKGIKLRISRSQLNAVLSVNRESILLYWDLGKQIVEKQQNAKWGNSVFNQLSKDLQLEFQFVSGFSKSNLYAMKQFYEVFSAYDENFHQPGGNLEYPEMVIIKHENSTFTP